MRYYIIAGEASGDLHGGNLIKAIHQQDESADVRCWGGDRMQAASATLVKHYRELAFMGFVEVIMHLRTIMQNMDFCKKDILGYKPDVLVLIDYPGFNMRIAEWAHAQGIKVVYYISPQVWAWKESRVKKLKRDTDKILVILPFEVDFYRKWDHDVIYVGHPLTEVVSEAQSAGNVQPIGTKPVIALLPGSRAQEIKIKLPVMLQVLPYFPQYDFVVAQAPAQPDSLYREIIGDKPVLSVRDETYNLLRQAKAALVTSGTATLETALFGVPEVVCYKGNSISYWLAKKLIKVKYISLVNLIMDKQVVTELIQDELNETNLRTELTRILEDGAAKYTLLQNYHELWDKLGGSPASANAAREIISSAK